MSEEPTVYTPADPKWHEQRRDRMHASELAGMLGICPFTTSWEVQQNKFGKLEPYDGTKSTSHGRDYENALLDIAERELGPLRRQVRVLHESLPLAATCDGITLGVNDMSVPGRPVECKTTGLVGPVYGLWGEAGSDEIPEYLLVQVHAQLMCTKSDLDYLYALIGQRGTVRFEIERSDTIAEMLGNQIVDWWEKHVIQGIAVEKTEPPKLEVVKRLRKIPNKVIQLDNNIDWIVDRWKEANDKKLAYEKEANGYQALILEALGDAEAGMLFESGRRLEFMEVVKHMKAKDAHEQRFRQLRIK